MNTEALATTRTPRNTETATSNAFLAEISIEADTVRRSVPYPLRRTQSANLLDTLRSLSYPPIHHANAEVLEPEANEQILLNFITSLGRAMRLYQAPVHVVENTIDFIAKTLGHRGDIFVAMTYIMTASTTSRMSSIQLFRTRPQDFCLAKLSQLDFIVRQALQGSCSIAEATCRIEALEQQRSWLHKSSVSLGVYVGIASLYMPYLQGNAISCMVAGIIGLSSFLVVRLGKHWPVFDALGEAHACFVGTIIAGIFHRLLPNVSLILSLESGVAPILPGLNVTLALLELSYGHGQAGSARLLTAIMLLLLMAAGNIMGMWVCQLLRLGPNKNITLKPLASPIVYSCIWPLAWVAGLAMHSRWMFWQQLAIVVNGVMGLSLIFSLSSHIPHLAATMISGFWVTSNALLYELFYHDTYLQVLLPTVLLIAPGISGLQTAVALLNADLPTTINAMSRMLSSGIGLVIGIRIAHGLIPYKPFQ